MQFIAYTQNYHKPGHRPQQMKGPIMAITQQIVDEIIALGLQETYIKGNASQQNEIIQVCADVVAQKIEKIQTKYMTCDEFKTSMRCAVSALVRQL